MIGSINQLSTMMGVTGTGFERPTPPRGEGGFDAIDANGDGSLDAEELQSLVAHAEARGHEAGSVEEMLAEFDIDGDGVLSRDEADTMHETMRERMASMLPGPPPGVDGSSIPTETSEDSESWLSTYMQNALQQYGSDADYLQQTLLDVLG